MWIKPWETFTNRPYDYISLNITIGNGLAHSAQANVFGRSKPLPYDNVLKEYINSKKHYVFPP